MKHHLVQQFREPNFITMPGTQKPLYAHSGIELLTLEKMSGISKVRRMERTRNDYRELKIKIFNLLERPRTSISIIYHASVFLLILGSLFFSVILTMKRFEKNRDMLNAVNYLEVSLIAIFAVEYILRLWSCSCHGNYTGFWGRLRFIKKPYMVIDIIVIVATVVVVATTDNANNSNYFSVSVFRFLRFLQVLRILRLDRQRGAFKIVSHVVYEHRQELLTCWYMSFILLVACSFLVYLAEKSDAEPDLMDDLGDGMYFAFITLLTVGYGDISPKNWVAKILTCIFAFVGTAFFALPAGILGSGFALQVAQNQKQKHFNRRRIPAALVIQYAWKVYASQARVEFNATWAPHQSLAVTRDKKFSIYSRSPTGTPTNARKISYLRKKFQNSHQKYSFTDGDAIHSRRSSIGATIPSALDLRDRCQSDGNLLLVSPHNIEENQATIVSLPPEYQESLHSSRNPLAATAHHSNQDLKLRPLEESEKNAIRFFRKVKLRVVLKKFREECRPYDVKDVIEQYTEGQMEMFRFIKKFQLRLESTLGVRDSEHFDPRKSVNFRLGAVEEKVKSIDWKLDRVLLLLEGRGNPRHERQPDCRSDRSDSFGSINGADGSKESVFNEESPRNNERPVRSNFSHSPRDRRRGMTFQADELSRRLEQIQYNSDESSAQTSNNNLLEIPSPVNAQRNDSRFTVTPTVLTPDIGVTTRDIDITSSNHSSRKGSNVDLREIDEGFRPKRKCVNCLSKSLKSIRTGDLDLAAKVGQSTSAPLISSARHSYQGNNKSSSPHVSFKSSHSGSRRTSTEGISQPLSLQRLFSSNDEGLDVSKKPSSSQCSDVKPNGKALTETSLDEVDTQQAFDQSAGPNEIAT